MAVIDIAWRRMVDCSGEVFHQKRGKSFVYSMIGETVILDTIDHDLPRHHIAEALARMPPAGAGEISDLGGASYIRTVPAVWRITGA